MSRAQRLLDLIQLLRQHRRPVSGAMLAEVLGISLRTLYRDVDTLVAQGAHIDGEAGVGYVLRQGFRHFRTDRIATLRVTDKRYPRRRQVMLKEWRQIEGILES